VSLKTGRAPSHDGATEGQANSIDWSAVHRRLQSVNAAIERAVTPSVDEKNSTLKERATILAREPRNNEAVEECLEIVEFLLAQERYGIETRHIREVYPMKELTPLPSTPPFVLGVVNARGRIVPVVDIKTIFGLPDRGLTDLNKLIIVRANGMELGLLADTIVGVQRVPLRDIQPSLPTLSGIRADYLKGVTKDRRVIIDAEKMLLDEQLLVHGDMEITE
jgi:purine-binding chemotaxis protein CheW